MQSCKFDKTGYNSYLIIVQPRRPPAPEAIIEEEEEEEDFFPRPSKYEPAKVPPPIEDDHRRSGKTGLPSLDDLPQPFGRLDLGAPPDRPSQQSGGQHSRRSLSSRLSSEADHHDTANEDDFGFPRPSPRFIHPSQDGDEIAREELESLEKYRPHNYELSQPKSEDINDLVDFYSNYRPHGRGRVSSGYRQRSLDPDDGMPVSYVGGEGEPRKKFSDPGQQRYDSGGGAYQNSRGSSGTRRPADENGFYDLDSIDPATRLILERARQTRSRPVESFGSSSSSYLRDRSPSQEDEFASLRPPPGTVNGKRSVQALILPKVGILEQMWLSHSS